MCRFYVFKFRPSSHSEDLTFIATYKSEEAAEKVYDTLKKMLEDMEWNPDDYETDWSPDEADVNLWGNEVWFGVYTAGYLDDVESVMKKVAIPEKLECYRDYQELVIRVKVPKGLTPETAVLVLDREEAEAIRSLMTLCGEPKIEKGEKDELVFVWYYRGDGIYDDGVLYLSGNELRVDERESWEVEECC